MEKKRPLGTTVFGILFVLISFISIQQGNPIFFLLHFSAGIGLLLVRPLGWKLALAAVAYGAILNISSIINAVTILQTEKSWTLVFSQTLVYSWYLGVCYYLTRPKLVEIFLTKGVKRYSQLPIILISVFVFIIGGTYLFRSSESTYLIIFKFAEVSSNLNTFTTIMWPFTFLVSICLLTSGVALLLLKPWSRFIVSIGLLFDILFRLYLTGSWINYWLRTGEQLITVHNIQGYIYLVSEIIILCSLTRPNVIEQFKEELCKKN